MKNIDVFTGKSDLGIDKAIENALDNAGNPPYFAILETHGSRDNTALCQYHAILKKMPSPETR